MLRHMCPPLGLGKRCPARVAYKVRKDPIFTWISFGCRGVFQGWGVQWYKRSTWCKLKCRRFFRSVSVSFSWKVGVGWLVLWRCVMVWDWWVEAARQSGWRTRQGCVSTGGDEKGDLLSSFAPCTTNTNLHKHLKATHNAINDVILFKLSDVVNIYMNAISHKCSDKHFTRVDTAKHTHTLAQKHACAAGLGRSARLKSSDSFRPVDVADTHTHIYTHKHAQNSVTSTYT